MFARALIAFVALPGMVAFVIPAAWLWRTAHLRVVFGEEPWLARTHGLEWERYASRVPRWFW